MPRRLKPRGFERVKKGVFSPGPTGQSGLGANKVGPTGRSVIGVLGIVRR